MAALLGAGPSFAVGGVFAGVDDRAAKFAGVHTGDDRRFGFGDGILAGIMRLEDQAEWMKSR